MRIRSGMTAVVLLAVVTVLLGGVARSQKPAIDQPPAAKSAAQNGAAAPKAPDSKKPGNPPAGRPEDKPCADCQTVELSLMIAGLGAEGCEVEVKPGNRSSRFRAQRLRVESGGKARFVFRDIELLGAEHNCTFSITVHEAGQSSRTIYRGFRISPRPAAGTTAHSAAQAFTCYLNSPSKLAGMERPGQTRQ